MSIVLALWELGHKVQITADSLAIGSMRDLKGISRQG